MYKGTSQGITLANADIRLRLGKSSKLVCPRLALKFHETDEYTLYPASILSVTKNRFTKHYFIGSKRIASRIGSGHFNNVYGMNGCNITAGQQDYAERLSQIESQKEDFYRKLGIAPGIPTMKGSYGDPENTGVGYNTIIKNLGDHSVPAEWAEYVKKNEKKETAPGAPIAWESPSQPEEVQPGYGFIPENESEETFYYHSDHLGSTSYVTDDSARITQYTAYLPYGELLVDEHSSSEDMPYKFNGKELDEETGLYYYGARYMNPTVVLFLNPDRYREKYPFLSVYNYCAGNPINSIDVNGDSVILYATTLPGLNEDVKTYIDEFGGDGCINPTHTFLAVSDKNGKYKHFAYGSEYDGFQGSVIGQLEERDYPDDLNVMNGKNTKNLKARIPITPPNGMSVEEFDAKVKKIAESFGNNPDIRYFMLPTKETEGNCNTSSSTILHKSGVSNEEIKKLKDQIPGISYGFGNYRPWTKDEQQKAVDNTLLGKYRNFKKTIKDAINKLF